MGAGLGPVHEMTTRIHEEFCGPTLDEHRSFCRGRGWMEIAGSVREVLRRNNKRFDDGMMIAGSEREDLRRGTINDMIIPTRS